MFIELNGTCETIYGLRPIVPASLFALVQAAGATEPGNETEVTKRERIFARLASCREPFFFSGPPGSPFSSPLFARWLPGPPCLAVAGPASHGTLACGK